MSTIVVAAQFTEGGGQPATGLTLADIDLYLTRVENATGLDTVVWDGSQHPTSEVDNCGAYTRLYENADLDQYTYFVVAAYTGATALDTDYTMGAVGETYLPATAEISFSGPVVEGGDVITYRGDTYLNEDDRALEWSSDDWPDLTGGSVVMIIKKVAQFAGTIVTPTGTAVVRLELSATQTATITAGRHNFQVVATQADGDVATLVDAVWVSRARAEV